MIKDVPKKIKLYWICEFCDKLNLWPDNPAKKYCDDKCRLSAHNKRRRKV